MIYFLEIFSQNLKLFGQKSLFLVRSMLILQKNLQKISIFVKNFWPVWPVNFLLLTRLTRNIFPFDPPTRWKIVGWPVTRPDPWNFQICWPDPTRPVENLLLPDPTRPVATHSIPNSGVDVSDKFGFDKSFSHPSWGTLTYIMLLKEIRVRSKSIWFN